MAEDLDWIDLVKALNEHPACRRAFVEIPPHVRWRIAALLDAEDIVYADAHIERENHPTHDGEPQIVSGAAVILTRDLLVSVVLNQVGWGEEPAGDLEVTARWLDDVVHVSTTGTSAGWSRAASWAQDPIGGYSLAFADGFVTTLPVAGSLLGPSDRSAAMGVLRRTRRPG